MYMKKTMHRRESNRPGRLFSRLLQQGRENEFVSIQQKQLGAYSKQAGEGISGWKMTKRNLVRCQGFWKRNLSGYQEYGSLRKLS